MNNKELMSTLQFVPISRINTLRNDEGRRAFTLIELLIAVLIIGVLAAIAVSAYQKAVLKSRFSSIIPPTKTIADAQEFYYMNNGRYATDTEDLEVTVKNNEDITLALSEKDKYKYVMGSHNKADKNHYIVYQKHSPKFADNIHCEAAKDDAKANWLCEKGLGGTLLTGSISGKNYLTYLIAGEVGDSRFIRTDCPAGQYDNEGTCTPAPSGHYAEDGELKKCPVGTYTDGYIYPKVSCVKCPAGQYNDTEGSQCKRCPDGMFQSETGATSCEKCPVGTYTNAFTTTESCTPCPAGKYNDTEGGQCKICPSGMFQSETGATSCEKCPVGTYTNGYISKESCAQCPEGTTSNADRTGCVSL